MSTIQFDDVDSILDEFKDLQDPRSHVNRRHLLGDLIVISIMAVIAGSDGPSAIGVWAKANAEWLKQHLKLPAGIPSHDTIERLLKALEPKAFQSCFAAWIARVVPDEKAPDLNQIAIDGKALRRSHDRRNDLGALFLVSAWSVDRDLSLGQLATEEKSNEITAIPELISQIDVENAVVTIDAAGCQTNIAEQIIKAKGDYVLALKGNQETLYQCVQDYIAKHMENDFADVDAQFHTETLKGHGRIDEISYYQLPAPADLINQKKWEGLKTVGVAIRNSERGTKSTTEVRYYIGSIEPDAMRFARYVRGHWTIENKLHWCLDVTFREDESRVRNRKAADNLAWLKRFGLSLLKQQNDKYSVAMRRRIAAWDINYLAQVLGIPTT